MSPSFFRPANRGVRVVLALLAVILLADAAPLRAATADWVGMWDTRWRDGGARLIVRQEGDLLVGEYPLYEGRIEGRAEDGRFVGTWWEGGASGRFVFIMSDDGGSFMGRFNEHEWWTGSRVSGEQAAAGARLLQTTPQQTLRSFALAGEAVENGQLEFFDDMLQLLHFPQDLDKTDELREASLLWLVIDRFRFRLIDVSQQAEGESYSFRLTRQDGKGYTLDFVRRDGKWFLEVPSTAALEASLAELLADSGGRVPPQSHIHRLNNARDTMEAFLDSMRAGQGGLDTAVATLDLSELSKVVRDREAVLLAQYLDEVLARIGEVVLQEVPNDPDREEAYAHFVHPAGNIVIAPVDTPDGVKWKFTPETLDTIRQLYAAAEDLPPPSYVFPYDSSAGEVFFKIRDLLRDVVPSALSPFGPLEIWQWLALLAVLLLALAGALLVGLTGLLLLWIAARRRQGQPGTLPRLLLWGLRVLVFGLIVYGGHLVLGLPDNFAGIVKTIAVVAMIAGAIPLQFWLVDAIRQLLDRYGAISQRGDILASLLVGLVKVAIVLGNFLLLAEALRIPYGAALAGFGIGGLAVALAARSTLENVIAGFILFADKPLAVGDFCRFGDKVGTVERIGIRSTELRTRDRTVISVPNAEFVNMHLENFGRRDRIFLHFTLGLRYETTPDQLRYALAELRRLLIAHPRVAEDPLRVRFIGFGSHALEVEIYAYVTTTDWAEFLGIREDIYLRMLELIEAAGTGIAIPSQTMYLGRARAPDSDRVRAAEAEVAAWREGNRLPFPNFTVEEIDAAANSIAFPPDGAPRATEQVAEGELAERRSRRMFWPFGRQGRTG